MYRTLFFTTKYNNIIIEQKIECQVKIQNCEKILLKSYNLKTRKVYRLLMIKRTEDLKQNSFMGQILIGFKIAMNILIVL